MTGETTSRITRPPTDEEIFEALPIGTLLKVREDMMDEPPTGDALELRKVVEKDGYIYRFAKWQPDEDFPVLTKSLATGREQEFHPAEVDPVEKEQEDD